MSLKGKKNAYTCGRCGHRFVTVDRDEGVTPFMTRCHGVGCGGRAQSSFYRIDQSEVATHEWYAPTEEELVGRLPSTRSHVRNGGLLLRTIQE